MPISLVIRDVLGYARSTREVRHILHNGHALIDGRICKDTRRGVGLMDVLTLGENRTDACLITTAAYVTEPSLQMKQAGRFAELKVRPPSKAVRLN